MAAVKQNGWALKYVGEDLKKDPYYPEIVMAAVKQNGNVRNFLISDGKLKGDIDYILTLVSSRNFKNVIENLTGNLQVLPVEQAMGFLLEELGNPRE